MKRMGSLVLVKFSAAWCSPCGPMRAVVQAVAEKYNTPLVEVDADEEPDMCIKYGVMSLPTVLLLEGGLVLARQVGACTVEKLETALSLA